MSIARVVVFLAIIGSLTLFVLQNASFSLSLVFLGMRSQTLPLSIWILISLAAGVTTSFLISGLLAFSNYLAEKEWRTRNGGPRSPDSSSGGTNQVTPPPSPRKPDLDPSVASWQNRETEVNYSQKIENETPSKYNVKTFLQEISQVFSPNVNAGVGSFTNEKSNISGENVGVTSPNEDIDDDWVEVGVGESSRKHGVSSQSDDDWGDEEEQETPSNNEDTEQKQTNYESQQEPKTQSWSGSVYSYGYREPKNTGVGQTESVYDANFRVITPPYTPTPSTPTPSTPPVYTPPSQSDDWEESRNNDDEDWGLEEDDEFDDDRSSDLRKRDRS
ncbi:hypothetical protein [Kamptonema sp. UHCC 0994]|uniref:hypothetical protein n=1 Tax=Kamptonema sp. UHCC 0994 TaxID=3031329 RepID=UPI0023B989E9|nr:hypothetical protein [Kamptonema sp. UHCC 0994]MDF0553609.1 hypothetical protein [Kamptonema sp. UHCC 0994]